MKKILVATSTLALSAGLAAAPSLTSPATAAPTRAGVTITIEGDDPFGEVRSPRRVCKAGVTVRLVKQIGTKGGGDDVATGISDDTELQGGVGTYSFGNPGLEDGRYYAKVRRTASCKAATSPTLVVDRD